MVECPVCQKPVINTPGGQPRVYCSPACRTKAYRRRKAVDWTRGQAPARVTSYAVPRPKPDDLEVRAIIGQRSVFTAAEALARELPRERAWRWEHWLAAMSEFVRLFGEF